MNKLEGILRNAATKMAQGEDPQYGAHIATPTTMCGDAKIAPYQTSAGIQQSFAMRFHLDILNNHAFLSELVEAAGDTAEFIVDGTLAYEHAGAIDFDKSAIKLHRRAHAWHPGHEGSVIEEHGAYATIQSGELGAVMSLSSDQLFAQELFTQLQSEEMNVGYMIRMNPTYTPQVLALAAETEGAEAHYNGIPEGTPNELMMLVSLNELPKFEAIVGHPITGSMRREDGTAFDAYIAEYHIGGDSVEDLMHYAHSLIKNLHAPKISETDIDREAVYAQVQKTVNEDPLAAMSYIFSAQFVDTPSRDPMEALVLANLVELQQRIAQPQDQVSVAYRTTSSGPIEMPAYSTITHLHVSSAQQAETGATNAICIRQDSEHFSVQTRTTFDGSEMMDLQALVWNRVGMQYE